MDISPSVNLLRSYRGERVNHLLLVGEGVDNALDANAMNIDVLLQEEVIRFLDDGIGITRDKIASVFALGDHASNGPIGRFGIGIKAQAINAGDLFEVNSTSASGHVRAKVDWADLLRSGGRVWTIADPLWRPVSAATRTGTIIIVSDLRKSPLPHLQKIRDEMAHRFYPAIAAGKRIVVNGEDIELLPEPPMRDVVDCRLSLSDGRNAHVRGGILVDPRGRLNRVHVAYAHRVIMPQSTVGCGGYSGLNGMFARVQIDGPWRLSRFKDDLPDDDEREELEQAVLTALEPILRKVSKEAISARVQHILDVVNDRIPDDLKPSRPRKKNPQDRSGDKAGRSNVAKDADADGPARTPQKRPRSEELRITGDGVAEQHGIGKFEKGRPSRVDLSLDHPFIARLFEHRDEELAYNAILMLAFSIYQEGLHRHSPDLFDAEFGVRVANTFAMQEQFKAPLLKKA